MLLRRIGCFGKVFDPLLSVPFGHRPQREHRNDCDADGRKNRCRRPNGGGKATTAVVALEIGDAITDQAAANAAENNGGDGKNSGPNGRSCTLESRLPLEVWNRCRGAWWFGLLGHDGNTSEPQSS